VHTTTYGWARDAVNWYGDGMGGGLLIAGVELPNVTSSIEMTLRYEQIPPDPRWYVGDLLEAHCRRRS
jgi:hypothetical protein